MHDPTGGGVGHGRNLGNAPRTDLPPTREPYDDDYFGTGVEEGVVREREAAGEGEEEAPAPAPGDRAGAEGAEPPG